MPPTKTPTTADTPATDVGTKSEYFMNPFTWDIMKGVAIETAIEAAAQVAIGPYSLKDSAEFAVYNVAYTGLLAPSAAKLILSTETNGTIGKVSNDIEARVLKFIGMSVMDIVVGNWILKEREGYKHVFLKHAITQLGATVVGKLMQ
jgi:hypothetical protein